MRNASKVISLGGMLAALAIVLMLLGGVIPGMTYIVPMACIFLECEILRSCGTRICWAWYGAVSILGILLCPDKEAAAVFLGLGSYPIIKPWMDRRKIPVFWKLLFFNVVILVTYRLLIFFLGAGEWGEEFSSLSNVLLGAMLLMGNVCFLLMDFSVTRFSQKGIAILWRRKKK